MSRYYNLISECGLELDCPSVTTIIGQLDKSDALTRWAANMACQYILDNIKEQGTRKLVDIINEARTKFREASQEACNIGSLVHDSIEKKLTVNDPKDLPDQAMQAYIAFLEFADEHELKPIALEKVVWTHRYAGTCDFYGYVDGVLTVLDWKTGSKGKVYPTHRYQIAAYKECFPLCVGSGIVVFDKATGYPTYKNTTKTHDADLAVFNCLNDLFFLKGPRIRSKHNKQMKALSAACIQVKDLKVNYRNDNG